MADSMEPGRQHREMAFEREAPKLSITIQVDNILYQ